MSFIGFTVVERLDARIPMGEKNPAGTPKNRRGIFEPAA
jgi:hypothetical protein